MAGGADLQQVAWRLARYLGLALLAYGVLLGVMLLTSRPAIYPFLHGEDVRSPGGLPGIELTELDGPRGPVLAWSVPADAGRPTVLLFVGNAGQLMQGVMRGAPLVEAGYGIAILNYPGANGAPGRPGQNTIMAAARTLYDHVATQSPQQPRPLVFGMSLGAAVAVHLAAEVPVAGVVLESPFTSTYELARDLYPFLPPVNLLPHNRWPVRSAAMEVTAPALVIHGARDSIVPPQHGERVAEALSGGAELVVKSEAGHNDLHLHGADAEVMRFVQARAGRD